MVNGFRLLQMIANTVLVAYRQLRVDGLLEFRRGRGVRARVADRGRAVVTEAARHFHAVGKAHGYSSAELAAMVANLPDTSETVEGIPR